MNKEKLENPGKIFESKICSGDRKIPMERLVLNIDKYMTIYNLKELKDIIITAYNKHSCFEIVARTLDDIHLSVIQLLFAFSDKAFKDNKQFKLTSSISEEYKALLSNTGIYNELFRHSVIK